MGQASRAAPASRAPRRENVGDTGAAPRGDEQAPAQARRYQAPRKDAGSAHPNPAGNTPNPAGKHRPRTGKSGTTEPKPGFAAG
jgi:hypothetical protein